MSDHGRYDYDITTGKRRNEERGSGRESGSMFGGGARERSSEPDDRPGQRGGWAEERENLSWGRGRQSGDRFEHDRAAPRGGWDRGRDGGGQGERMSSGWGPGLGERSRDSEMNRRDHEEDNRGYGRDDERSGLPIEETSRLIASNKVEGTAVYGRDGHRLGSIYNFMVDKLSGRVEYAVMRYGGTLGMGQRYYPLPWQILTYDTRQGGYRIELTGRDLRDAPSFDRETEPHFDESYGDRVHSWYGLGRR